MSTGDERLRRLVESRRHIPSLSSEYGPLTEAEYSEYRSRLAHALTVFEGFTSPSRVVLQFVDPEEPVHTWFYSPTSIGSVAGHTNVVIEPHRQLFREPDSGAERYFQIELVFAEPYDERLPMPRVTGLNSNALATAVLQYGEARNPTREGLDQVREFEAVLIAAAESALVVRS